MSGDARQFILPGILLAELDKLVACFIRGFPVVKPHANNSFLAMTIMVRFTKALRLDE